MTPQHPVDVKNTAILRELLRDQTSDAHSEAEAAIRAHADPSTAHGYERFLTAHASLYHRYGPNLDHASDLLGLPRRAAALLGALVADLDQLNASLADTWAVAEVDLRPQPAGRLLGIAYVLEGSTNGARTIRAMIRRQTRQNRPMRPIPVAFVELLHTDSETRWPNFARALANYPLADAELKTAAASANEVFESLTQTVNTMRVPYK